MRINSIELYNIGSYEGRNCFDILAQGRDGKIVLIGGKNGAGKTTLFTSIKLCLYGYKESGYQAMNAYYKRQIKKLINDKAKIENHGNAFVALSLNIHNGQEWDEFFIKRRWSLKDDNFERFSVWKNDVELSVEEISDFENYLLNLIPPELFELYFCHNLLIQFCRVGWYYLFLIHQVDIHNEYIVLIYRKSRFHIRDI